MAGIGQNDEGWMVEGWRGVNMRMERGKERYDGRERLDTYIED